MTYARDVLSAVCLAVIASAACSPEAKPRTPNFNRVPVSIELRLAEGAAGQGLMPAEVYGQGKTVYLHPEAQVSKTDIVRVEAVKTRIGQGLILQIWLTRPGAARLKEATGRHIGDSLAVLVDSVVMAVPAIQQPIGGDRTLPIDIGVPLQPKEAQQLAASVSKTWPPKKSRR